MEVKKVLVISYNCLNIQTADGRTLENILSQLTNATIANLYFCNENPNSKICNIFFRFTDIDALKRIFFLKSGKETFNNNTDEKNKNILESKIKKNKNKLFIKYFRAKMWDFALVRKYTFIKWLDNFMPNVIFYNLSPNPFEYKIVKKIAIRYNIPIIIYNSEDYHLKPYEKKGIFGKLYKNKMNHNFLKLKKNSNIMIYNSEELKKDFSVKYPMNCEILLPIASNFEKKYEQSNVISYLGNLGLGRVESLIEMAKVAKEVDNSINFNIYGKINDEKMEERIKSCDFINYMGYTDYDNVKKIIQSSKLVVHAESFENDIIEDIKHAFSTKIVDCLACDTAFLMYAPIELTSAHYLKDECPCCIATNKNELYEMMNKILINDDFRKDNILQTKLLVQKNHNIEIIKDKINFLFNKAIGGDQYENITSK